MERRGSGGKKGEREEEDEEEQASWAFLHLFSPLCSAAVFYFRSV